MQNAELRGVEFVAALGLNSPPWRGAAVGGGVVLLVGVDAHIDPWVMRLL